MCPKIYLNEERVIEEAQDFYDWLCLDKTALPNGCLCSVDVEKHCEAFGITVGDDGFDFVIHQKLKLYQITFKSTTTVTEEGMAFIKDFNEYSALTLLKEALEKEGYTSNKFTFTFSTEVLCLDSKGNRGVYEIIHL